MTLITGQYYCQIINYVNNPGFENALPTVTMNTADAAKNWGPLDSSLCASYLLMGKPPIGVAPYNQFGFQYPRSGDNFIISQFYCNTCLRWYPRNRLKQKLRAGIIYCAKYYIVNTNNNRVGIDSYGIFFGDKSIDTISNCMVPLTFLNPQVENPNGIITDTLNWIPVSGTFVANGTEEYLVLGNFRSNAATNTLLINTPLTILTNDVYIDDVSVLELELPAFAGRDTSITPGDSIYLGRESDIGIDEACMWYQLPTVITPTTPAIDTIAGFWLKPVSNCTFVVRQQLWCSGVKWDTVVIHLNPVGIEKHQRLAENLILSPNPAKDHIQIQYSNAEIHKFNHLQIFNNVGQLIREEDIDLSTNNALIITKDLPNGIYTITFNANSEGRIVKKLVISR